MIVADLSELKNCGLVLDLFLVKSADSLPRFSLLFISISPRFGDLQVERECSKLADFLLSRLNNRGLEPPPFSLVKTSGDSALTDFEYSGEEDFLRFVDFFVALSNLRDDSSSLLRKW